MQTTAADSPPVPAAPGHRARPHDDSHRVRRHTWKLVCLQLMLGEQGHPVINLEDCVPGSVVLDEAQRAAQI